MIEKGMNEWWWIYRISIREAQWLRNAKDKIMVMIAVEGQVEEWRHIIWIEYPNGNHPLCCVLWFDLMICFALSSSNYSKPYLIDPLFCGVNKISLSFQLYRYRCTHKQIEGAFLILHLMLFQSFSQKWQKICPTKPH